jgi:anti-sigma factor RsiW
MERSDGCGGTEMTCEETEILLHALADDELDVGNARAVEAHVASCPRCAQQLRDIRDIRAALAGRALRFEAPASLRTRIEASLATAAPAPRPVRTSRRSLLQGFALGTAMSSAIAASVVVMMLRGGDEQRIIGEAVSAHLRSLQGEHLTDVLSTDQHTVKPWFNGRVEFAPPVIDLTAQGFTLIGGRLDYVDGKSAAALVYQRRKHVINLFVTQSGSVEPPHSGETIQGFNIRRWSSGGLTFIAVSDINADELQEFDDKFEAADRPKS